MPSAVPVTIRRYAPADIPNLATIYYRSVREVGIAKYSREQVEAWAPDLPETAHWVVRLSGIVFAPHGWVVGELETVVREGVDI